MNSSHEAAQATVQAADASLDCRSAIDHEQCTRIREKIAQLIEDTGASSR